MALTFIDIFCGAGGSSLGLTAAGFELRLAANHWSRAIETHSSNFGRAEHLCADVSNYDMRRLPPARVLWASPICWEVSPAGGNGAPDQKRMAEAAGGAGEPAPSESWGRTRATAYDVIRATEVWNFDAVLVENVVEFATRWALFRWWLEGMAALGYRYRIVCVNSAHIGGPGNQFAPQWRDRMYLVFVRTGIAMPDLEPRPLAFCPDCGEYVRARQSWKDTRWGRVRIGKYRRQYVFSCPNRARQHESLVVEPYVLPAATVIDWSDVGPRIGELRRPLRPSTIAKIVAGIDMVRQEPAATQRHRGNVPLRGGRPSNCGLRPFIAELRGGGSTSRPIEHPLATITAGGLHHGLVTPSGSELPCQWTGLVVPYRRSRAKTTAEPLHAVATRSSAALVQPANAIENCHFRMLRPREHLRAQRFPDSYIVRGNRTEQTAQAGNAVSANVAQWIGQQLAVVLS